VEAVEAVEAVVAVETVVAEKLVADECDRTPVAAAISRAMTTNAEFNSRFMENLHSLTVAMISVAMVG
jgi:hypothetical protein